MITENIRREFAEGPLSAVTADAHPFLSIIRSAPITALGDRIHSGHWRAMARLGHQTASSRQPAVHNVRCSPRTERMRGARGRTYEFQPLRYPAALSMAAATFSE